MAGRGGARGERAGVLRTMPPRLLLAAVWSDDGGPGLRRGIAIRREVERRLSLSIAEPSPATAEALSLIHI
eukprot:5713401-Alexandrium_andersonii.AAC.1